MDAAFEWKRFTGPLVKRAFYDCVHGYLVFWLHDSKTSHSYCGVQKAVWNKLVEGANVDIIYIVDIKSRYGCE